jgi:periplasmic divalent cation tolerance protein
MTDFVQVSTTTASREEAEQIAIALVEQRLAACVQLIPQVQSVYRWQGKVEQASECLCVAKTHRSLLSQVEAAIHQAHTYACPELIMVPIEHGSRAYLDWLAAQLAG